MTHYYLLGGTGALVDDEFDSASVEDAFKEVKARIFDDYNLGIADEIYLGDITVDPHVVDGELRSIDTRIEIAIDIDGEKYVYGHLMYRMRTY